MPDTLTEGPAAAGGPRPDLTALIGSRICHDLISPLGAIGNGVELLMMAGGPASPEMTLISESVASANARIRFFRVAFGASARGQQIGEGDIRAILGDVTRGGRLAVDWLAAGSHPRGAVKLAFLAIQCLETAMPFGGRISATCEGDGWAVTGETGRLRIDETLWAQLFSAPSADLAPAQVHFALLPDEAARQGRRLVLERGEGMARITF